MTPLSVIFFYGVSFIMFPSKLSGRDIIVFHVYLMASITWCLIFV